MPDRGRAANVVEALGLFKLGPEVTEAALVLPLRFGIQDRPGVTKSADASHVQGGLFHGRPYQLRGTYLAPRMAQQVGDVAETLGILEANQTITVSDRPNLVLAPEHESM